MRLTVLAAALLAASALSAQAGFIGSTTCSYNGFRPGYTCHTTYGEVSAEPRVIQIPPSDDPEREARIQKWEAFCKPQINAGRFGVYFYTYAHDGCEFGRAE